MPARSSPTRSSARPWKLSSRAWSTRSASFGMWSLAEAKPVGSAKVSVIRKNYKNRVTYWKTFRAEESSYFYAELKGYKMSHSILDHRSKLDECVKHRLVAPSKRMQPLVQHQLWNSPQKRKFEASGRLGAAGAQKPISNGPAPQHRRSVASNPTLYHNSTHIS
ncbi:hypothetical protein NL676_036969 [Syzygium grande]|nr:hypothetical protein NL676_036969 [Syzygium grande]